MQRLKDRAPDVMELCAAVGEAYGSGRYTVNNLTDYLDYAHLLETERIADVPKFEQFMLRFSNIPVRPHRASRVRRRRPPDLVDLGFVWNQPGGKLAVIQEMNGQSNPLAGIIIKMAFFGGRTPDASIPQFFLE